MRREQRMGAGAQFVGVLVLAGGCALSGCNESGGDAGDTTCIGLCFDAGPGQDSGVSDAGPVDAGTPDAGPADAGPMDAGPTDAGPTDAGPTDAGPSDAGFVVAAHPSFPLVPSAGGPVLASPELTVVTWAGYPYEQRVDDYARWIMTSSWQTTAGADYGVGTGSFAGHVVLDAGAPANISDGQIETLLSNLIADGGLSAPNTSSIYLLFFPDTTTVSRSGLSGCTAFGGYHYEMNYQGTRFAYAVLPTCAGGEANLSEGQAIEAFASHEIMEAATDPFPGTAPGYVLGGNVPWSYIGTEVADICNGSYTPFTASAFLVQRIWSNTAAKAGASPCVPIPPGETYFNVSPNPNGISLVPAGMSVTLALTGWSTAQVDGGWPLLVNLNPGYDFIPSVDLKPSANFINGTSGSLVVDVPAGTPSGSQSVLILVSPTDPISFAFWPIVIQVP